LPSEKRIRLPRARGAGRKEFTLIVLNTDAQRVNTQQQGHPSVPGRRGAGALLCLLVALLLILLVRADLDRRGVSSRCVPATALCLYVAPDSVALTWTP